MRLPGLTAPISRSRPSRDYSAAAWDHVHAATFVDQKCLSACQASCDNGCSDLTGPARGSCLRGCLTSCTTTCTRPGKPPTPPPVTTCEIDRTYKTVCWPIPVPPGIWCWQEQDQCTLSCCTPQASGDVACSETPC